MPGLSFVPGPDLRRGAGTCADSLAPEVGGQPRPWMGRWPVQPEVRDSGMPHLLSQHLVRRGIIVEHLKTAFGAG